MKLVPIQKYIDNPVLVPLQKVVNRRLEVEKLVGFGGAIERKAKPPKRAAQKFKEATQAEYKRLKELGMGKFLIEKA